MKDIVGEGKGKCLYLETDEMVWGTWVEGNADAESGGKNAKSANGGKFGGSGRGVGRGLAVATGNKGRIGVSKGINSKCAKEGKENAAPVVRIPAKYTDV